MSTILFYKPEHNKAKNMYLTNIMTCSHTELIHNLKYKGIGWFGSGMYRVSETAALELSFVYLKHSANKVSALSSRFFGSIRLAHKS